MDVRHFREIDRGVLEQALAQFKALGGAAEEACLDRAFPLRKI